MIFLNNVKETVIVINIYYVAKVWRVYLIEGLDYIFRELCRILAFVNNLNDIFFFVFDNKRR